MTESPILEGVVSEPAVSPSEEPKHAALQVHPVASESDGYKAPGGLTRDEIRDRMRRARPYSKVDVTIEEWDIAVEVRSMSLGTRNEMAARMVNEDGTQKNMTAFYPAVIIACTYDGAGDLVFSLEDQGWIESLDAHVLDKIALPALEINGMKDAPKKVEDEAGKSEKTDASASAS